MKRVDLLFFLFSAFSFCVQAQPDRDDYVLGFRILRAEKKAHDLWLITIDRGEEASLKPGTSGEVWGRIQSQEADHNKKLGTAIVKSSTAGKQPQNWFPTGKFFKVTSCSSARLFPMC